MPGNRQQSFPFYRGRTPGNNIGAFFFGGCVEGFGFEWLCVASGFIALRAFICSQAFASLVPQLSQHCFMTDGHERQVPKSPLAVARLGLFVTQSNHRDFTLSRCRADHLGRISANLQACPLSQTDARCAEVGCRS